MRLRRLRGRKSRIKKAPESERAQFDYEIFNYSGIISLAVMHDLQETLLLFLQTLFFSMCFAGESNQESQKGCSVVEAGWWW